MGNHLDLPATTTYGEQHTQITGQKGSQLTYRSTLGGSSFLRTFHYVHSHHGLVVVKVYTIREIRDRDENSRNHPPSILAAQDQLLALNEKLEHIRSPHVCRYRTFEIKSSLAYMLRPYLYSTLNDRVLVRPHLADIDRLWLTYQLMEAVAATHACGVRHGDLKPENVLLTSWNWLLLSDLAPYKPVYLNLEHTADFTYFFDTSGSRRCCIAPERFVRGSAAVLRARAGAHVSASMDTFSLGCIIAELWIGEPLFQYSDMMAFIQDRRMGTQTRERMKKLKACNADLAEMVEHMTRMEPENRLSVDEYLHKWPKTVFPAFFHPLHDLLSPLMTWAQDHSVLLLKASFSGFLTKLKQQSQAQNGEQENSGAPGESVGHEATQQQSGTASSPGLTSQAVFQGHTDVQRGTEQADRGSELAGSRAMSGVPVDHGARFNSASEAAGDQAEVSGADAVYQSASVASGADGETDRFEVVPHRADVPRVPNEDPFPALSKPMSLDADMFLQPGAQGEQQLRQLDVMSSAKAGAVQQIAKRFEANVVTELQTVQALTLLACVLCIALRGAVTLEARWECIQMLFVVGMLCDDTCRVEWVMPYLLNFVVPETTSAAKVSQARRLPDRDSVPRAVVLRHLHQMWTKLQVLPRSEHGLFGAYLVPAIIGASDSKSSVLRRELFLALPSLASTAQRLFSVAVRKVPEASSGKNAQAAALAEQLAALRRTVADFIQARFLPEDPAASRALSGPVPGVSVSVSNPATVPRVGDAGHDGWASLWVYLMRGAGQLAEFLGPEQATSTLLPTFMWLPNESDWRVRAAFYQHLPVVAQGLGEMTLTRVFLPVIEATLSKENESVDVLMHALNALTALLLTGVISPSEFLSPLRKPPALRLLVHRSASVRGAAIALFSGLAAKLDVADLFALLCPALQHALGLDSAPDLNPLLFSECDIVADYMRQLVETSGATTANQPASRVEYIQSITSNSPISVQHLHSNYTTSGPRSSSIPSSKRVVADTADPQLHANESLHSLALQHAGVQRPPSAADASGALRRLCNGAVCASLAPGESLVHQGGTDMVGARSRAPMAGSRPQTVLAELSTRLMMESREQSSVADGDGVPQTADFCAGPQAQNVPDGVHDFAPRGVLVAHMAEHQHAINSLSVSHSRCNWFASASSDGTVKLWGCAKEGVHIDKVGCFSSLLSYSAHEGAVTDVKLLSDDSMDSVNVASIDSTGQLHLWDVSVQPRKAISQRPTLAFPPASPAHLNLDCGNLTKLQQWGPLLLVSSECGGIRAYDPRAGARKVWQMEVPAHHGVTSCLAAVPGAPALCSGTTRGMMHVWDMRMQLRVDSRWHPRQTHIHTMACPSAPPLMLGLQRYTNSAPLIYVAGEGNEIVLYDLQNFKTKIKFNAWMPRSPQAQPEESPVATEISDMQQAKLPGQVREGMRALLPMPSGGLLCAGTDKCIRYLHTKDKSKCYLVCGLLKGYNPGTLQGVDVRYSHTTEENRVIVREEAGASRTPRPVPTGSTVSEERSIRRLQAQCHRDCITSMALAALPSGPVLLSASRDGLIKAWR